MATMEVELTDIGKLQDHYPQGIPYRIPPDVDRKPTVRKVRARGPEGMKVKVN